MISLPLPRVARFALTLDCWVHPFREGHKALVPNGYLDSETFRERYEPSMHGRYLRRTVSKNRFVDSLVP